MAEPEDEPPSVLLPCSICSRTFKPESLQKHIKVCEKQLTKKRKVFDSSKQRIQGTELAEFLPIILREKKSEKVPVKKQESKWKEKHLEFVRAIRAARGVEVESNKSVPAPRSNHEKCPHCDRNFGPKAFDRHVEWCKEQKARIPKSPGSLQAKERLEARTKYRAPPLAKSKRTLTREKYAKVSRVTQEMSPMSSRSIMTFSKMSPHNLQESKTTEMNTKIQGVRNKPKVSASSPSCILPGGNIQIKRREPSPSPSKRPIRSKNIGKTSVVKEKSEDKHRENTFTTSNISKLQPTNEKVVREGKSHATDKRLPVPKASLTVQKTQERKSGQPKVCAQSCKSNDGSSSKSYSTDNPHPQGKLSYQPKSSALAFYKSTPSNILSEGANHDGSVGVVPVSFHDGEGNISCETLKRTESRAHGSITRRQKPKLNDIDVNHKNEGLIVSPCAILKAEDNFITWRDIARNCESLLKRTNTDVESDDCNRTYTVVSSCTDDSQINNDVGNAASVEELNSEEYYTIEGYSSGSEMCNQKEKECWKTKHCYTDATNDDCKLNYKKEPCDINHYKGVTGEVNLNDEKISFKNDCVDSVETCEVSTGMKEENVLVLPMKSSCVKVDNYSCIGENSCAEEDGANSVIDIVMPASNQNPTMHTVQTMLSSCELGKSSPIYEKDANYISFGVQNSVLNHNENCSSFSTDNSEDKVFLLKDWNDSLKDDQESDSHKSFNSHMTCSEGAHLVNEEKTFDQIKVSKRSGDSFCEEENRSLDLRKDNSTNCKLMKEVKEINQISEGFLNSSDCYPNQSKNTNDFSQLACDMPCTHNNIEEIVTDSKIPVMCSNEKTQSDLQDMESFCSDVSKHYNLEKLSTMQYSTERCCLNPSESGELTSKSVENEVLCVQNSDRIVPKLKKQFPFCRKSCFCCFEKTGQLTQEQACEIWQSCKKEALDFLGLPDSSKTSGPDESCKSDDDVIDRIWDLASQEFIKVMKEKSNYVCSLGDEISEYNVSDPSQNIAKENKSHKYIENKKRNKYYLGRQANCKNKCSSVVLSAFCSKIKFIQNKSVARKVCSVICKSCKEHKKMQKLNQRIKKSFYLESVGKIIFLCNEAVFTTLAIKSGRWLNFSKNLKTVLDTKRTTCLINQNDSSDMYKSKSISNNGFKMCGGSYNSSPDSEKLKTRSGARINQLQMECASTESKNTSVGKLKQSEVNSQPISDSTQTNEEVEEILRIKSATENVTIHTYELMEPSELNFFAENYHNPPICHLENLILDHEYGFPEDTCFPSFYTSGFTELQGNASLGDMKCDRDMNAGDCFYPDVCYPDVYFQGSDHMYGSIPFYEMENQYYIPEHVYNPAEMCPSEIPYTLYVIPGNNREGCIITECSEEENAREKPVPCGADEKFTQNFCSQSNVNDTKHTSQDSLKKSKTKEDSIDDTTKHGKFRNPISVRQDFDKGNVKISGKNILQTDGHGIRNLNGNELNVNDEISNRNGDCYILPDCSLGDEKMPNFTTMCVNMDCASVTSHGGVEYCDSGPKTFTYEKQNNNEKLNLIKKSRVNGINNTTGKQSQKNNSVNSSVSNRKSISISSDTESKLSNVSHSIKLKKLIPEEMSNVEIRGGITSHASSSDSLETNEHTDTFKNSLECFDLYGEEGKVKIQNSSEFMGSRLHASYDNQMEEVKEKLEDISCLGVNFPSFLYEHIDYHNGNCKVWTNSIKQKSIDCTNPNEEIKVRMLSAKNDVKHSKAKSSDDDFGKRVEKSMFDLQKSNDCLYEKAGKVNLNYKSFNTSEQTKSSVQKSNRYDENTEVQSQANYCLLREKTEIFDTPSKQIIHYENKLKCKNNIALPEIQADQAPKLKSAKEHNASLSKLVEKWMTKQKKVKTSQSEQEVNKKIKTDTLSQKRNIRKTHRLPPLSTMPKCQLKTSSSEEVYDPYVSAERQMMELLSQGDYVQPSVQHVQLSSTESSPVFPSFDSSHKSAFVSPEPHRKFPSSKSHFEKGDADKRVYEENCIYKIDTSTEPESKAKCYSTGGKFSADSAYGRSLKRRSPGNQLPEKHDVDGGEGEPRCVMSSSSSESSLPPLCSVQVLKSEASNASSSPTPSHAVSASPVTQSVPRMSKFCHECGSRYPVSLAKFCCECGVRRLAM